MPRRRLACTCTICYNAGSMSNAGMQQGMKQSMVATAAMQQFMRTLQATNM